MEREPTAYDVKGTIGERQPVDIPQPPLDIVEFALGRQRPRLLQHRIGRIKADGTTQARGKRRNDRAWTARNIKRLIIRLRRGRIHDEPYLRIGVELRGSGEPLRLLGELVVNARLMSAVVRTRGPVVVMTGDRHFASSERREMSVLHRPKLVDQNADVFAIVDRNGNQVDAARRERLP